MERRNSALCLIVVFTCSVSSLPSIVSSNEHSLVLGQSSELQIAISSAVEKSPGYKPGTVVLCERVKIHGLPRMKELSRFADSVRVKVANVNSSARSNVEVCFHRNQSLGLGMCHAGEWQKLVKGSWVGSMSPFDHKLLDIRMAGSSPETLQLSGETEFLLYRVIFLAVGIILLTLASSLSKSLVFYYSSAMTIGIILVILMILFQIYTIVIQFTLQLYNSYLGMKLLPTGRKNSIAIFIYSSMAGVGSFLLSYAPRLLHTVFAEMGISEDMYNPLAIFLLLFLLLAGAWLGFWVVRKLILTEDGSIDSSVSYFVAWSIRLIAAAMILQCSVDPLLASAALLSSVLVSWTLRRLARSRFIRHLNKPSKNPRRADRSKHKVSGSSPLKDEYVDSVQNLGGSEFSDHRPRPSKITSPLQGSARAKPTPLSLSETFFSSFHRTPDRRKFAKAELEQFTKDNTKRALAELVASPDFSDWAVARADRITLAPDTVAASDQRRRWFYWF